MSLVSEVASLYFLLRDLDNRLELTRNTVATRKESTRILSARFDTGYIAEVDKLQKDYEILFNKVKFIQGDLFKTDFREATVLPMYLLTSVNLKLRPRILREMKPDARTHLSINERGRIHLIPVSEVLFLKAELKYVTVRTAAREYLLEESLAKLEQEFFGRFVRVHRNCLVAKEAIRGFERAVDAEGEGHWVVALNNVDEKIAVSRRQQVPDLDRDEFGGRLVDPPLEGRGVLERYLPAFLLQPSKEQQPIGTAGDACGGGQADGAMRIGDDGEATFGDSPGQVIGQGHGGGGGPVRRSQILDAPDGIAVVERDP